MEDKNPDEIEALTINIPLLRSPTPNNKNFKASFTLLELIKKAMKIVITFINRLFSHSLFTMGKVSSNAICNTINSDFFTYTTTYRYLSDKFYEIIINTSVFKYLIAGYK